MKNKILIICDDIYHHEEVLKNGLSFLSDKYELEFTNVPCGQFENYSAVILAKDDVVSKDNKENWLTADIEKQIENYVNNGGGIIFLHAGTVICKKSAILKSIAGCAFITHPEQCEINFLITSKNPQTEGAENFCIKDEHYFIDFTADDAEIFLESHSAEGKQPAGYTRMQKKGRVCVLTPGHNPEVFDDPQYQKIIQNALDFCAATSPK